MVGVNPRDACHADMLPHTMLCQLQYLGVEGRGARATENGEHISCIISLQNGPDVPNSTAQYQLAEADGLLNMDGFLGQVTWDFTSE